MKRRTRTLFVCFSAALVSASCSVGPDYSPPEAPLSEGWIESGDQRLGADGALDLGTWWSALDDERLTELIERALEGNLTLRAAGKRIVQSRAARGIARGDLFPQLQEAFGGYSRNALSKESFAPPERHFDTWSAGFEAAWELDVWGRFRRALESSNAVLDASVAGFHDVQVLLTAEVGLTYIDIRSFQERLRLARENVRIQRETLDLASTKFEGGAVSKLDVDQAETNLRRTEALIPLLETGLRQSNNNLCVLLGVPPEDLLQELGDRPIPSVPQSVAVGVPANVLRQRPDIRRSERLLAAQSARIGIAKADLFPRLSLIGTIGYEAQDLSSLGKDAFFGSVGPSIRWNVLNYGRIQNAVRVEKARFEELALDYQNTVIVAQREAEDAMTAFLRSLEEVSALRAAAASAAEAVQLGTTQYQGGLVDFNRVFLLQTDLVSIQDRLATAEGRAAQNLVALFKALGGGWSSPVVAAGE